MRDLLRGAAVNDWDVCTSALPKHTRKAFSKVIPTGIAHGTVTVLWKGEGYEVTTLRGEGAYTDGRRPDEVFFVDDIAEDLARRDFTVNAMAFDPVSEELVDPYGGKTDLRTGVLKAVGVAAERFSEDGLRILRGARFVATLGLELEADTEAAFGPTLDVFAKVSPERVREEWMKAMKTERPSPAFVVMKRTGILGRCCALLDELDEDAFDRALAALDRTEPADGPSFRLAALLHQSDLKALETWLRDYRYSNDEKRDISELVRWHDLSGAIDWSDERLRRFLSEAGRVRGREAVRLYGCIGGEDVESLLARVDDATTAAIAVGDLEVDGKDVIEALGGPGRAVGEILRQLLEEALVDPTTNNRTAQLARIATLAKA